MSCWNYRVISHPDGGQETGRWLMVHEVFYNDEGVILFWSENGKTLGGETMKDLMECFSMMRKDVLKFPVLMIEDLEKAAGKKDLGMADLIKARKKGEKKNNEQQFKV